jgi:sugar phosphate isomerase/epimerase
MSYDRRKFIRATGVLASAIAFGTVGCKSENKKEESKAEEPATTPKDESLNEFGIQLYTVRDDLPKDPKGVLKQLAADGYKQVESFEGSKGIFWGMTNKDFKKYLDEIGMVIVSSHCDINKDFDKKAAQAAEIGMKYLIAPWIGPQKTVDDYKKFASKFNSCGEICKKNNIRFAYHNHDYSFKDFNGQFPQDIIMQNTNPEIVDFEMDIYWVVTAGADPIAWLQKYPNRFRLGHLKDRKKDADPKDTDASCDLGKGMIDFSKVLRVGRDNGMQYYIVEQERYDNSTPLKSAQVDAEYLKTLTI